MTTSPLISAAQLKAILGSPDLWIADASWHLDGRDAALDFEAGHIPGAVRFDLETASAPRPDLPHMLPSPEAFAAYAGSLGARAEADIVVYDTAGLFSAARVWWMFRLMGARSVRVLDGGLPAWRREGGPIETGSATPVAATFAVAPDLSPVADAAAVTAALADGGQVLDARGAARFRGEAAEPRPGVRAGHMPGATNLPYAKLLDDDGRMKRGAELAEVFASAGVDTDRPVITTCGSGVTAAIISLAIAELGGASRLYDGSWAEWGARADLPVELG